MADKKKTVSATTEKAQDLTRAVVVKESEAPFGHAFEAKFRRLTVLASDVGTYDIMNPSPTPGSATTTPSITELETIYATNPIVIKAINIRTMIVRPSQKAEKLPATRPERMFKEGPP